MAALEETLLYALAGAAAVAAVWFVVQLLVADAIGALIVAVVNGLALLLPHRA